MLGTQPEANMVCHKSKFVLVSSLINRYNHLTAFAGVCSAVFVIQKACGGLVLNQDRTKRAYYHIRWYGFRTSIAHTMRVLLDKKLREHILAMNHM